MEWDEIWSGLTRWIQDRIDRITEIRMDDETRRDKRNKKMRDTFSHCFVAHVYIFLPSVRLID